MLNENDGNAFSNLTTGNNAGESCNVNLRRAVKMCSDVCYSTQHGMKRASSQDKGGAARGAA